MILLCLRGIFFFFFKSSDNPLRRVRAREIVIVVSLYCFTTRSVLIRLEKLPSRTRLQQAVIISSRGTKKRRVKKRY